MADMFAPLVAQLKANPKTIVFTEGNDPRILEAASKLLAEGVLKVVMVGNEAECKAAAAAGNFDISAAEIIDPENYAGFDEMVNTMVELRKGKGLNAPMAAAQLEDSVVLGTMMLALDEVDGLVSGAIHTTANTIRPALQLIKTAPGYRLVSSVFFMLLPDEVVVYGDCAVNPDPNAEELAEIALQSAASAEAFGIPSRVAMISYSTGDSGSGEEVEKVRSATRIARERNPQLLIDGPLQYDAASVVDVGRQMAFEPRLADGAGHRRLRPRFEAARHRRVARSGRLPQGMPGRGATPAEPRRARVVRTPVEPVEDDPTLDPGVRRGHGPLRRP